MRRNLVSEILERLQYLFFIDLATILTHCYVLIVTRPKEKNQIYSPFRKPIFIIHLRKIFFELRITSGYMRSWTSAKYAESVHLSNLGE